MPSIKLGVVKQGDAVGRLKEIIKTLGKDAHVKVGVLDDGKGAEQRDGGLTNAQIAAVHEFGSADGRIPERSFIRTTFNKNKGGYVASLRAVLTRVVEGRATVEQGFNAIGAKIASDIKSFVAAGGDPSWPPLADSTMARKEAKRRKGSTGKVRTLIDTGRMIASVTWAFVKGS